MAKQARKPKSWKTGQSGNPKGRPRKGNTMTDLLKEFVKAKVEVEGIGKIERRKAWLMKFDEKWLNEGDLAAGKYLWDRLEGTPVQKEQITGEDEGPITIKFIDE